MSTGTKRKLIDTDPISLQHPNKRLKTSNIINSTPSSSINTKDRKWTAMEIYCIMDLSIHPDSTKFYTNDPDLDPSLFFLTQDWIAVADWMSTYFGKEVSMYCFKNNIRPKVPYTAQELKKCAIDIITKHNDGKLPITYHQYVSTAQKAREIYNKKAQQFLDEQHIIFNTQQHLNQNGNQNLNQNSNVTNIDNKSSTKINLKTDNKLSIPLASIISNNPVPTNNINSSNTKQMKKPVISTQKVISKTTSKSPTMNKALSKPISLIKGTVIKTTITNNRQQSHMLKQQMTKSQIMKQSQPKVIDERAKCHSHLLSVLEKLSQYNDTTRKTMLKKLDDKYNARLEAAKASITDPNEYKVKIIVLILALNVYTNMIYKL